MPQNEKNKSVYRLLMQMNLLILMTGVISIVAALEIAKGARLHELNFKHVKYNHLLDNGLATGKFDSVDGRLAVRDLLVEVRKQPIACLKEVNIAERLAMRTFGTYEALNICRRDIALADSGLHALDHYENGQIDQAALMTAMYTTVDGFRQNSIEFEPLVIKSVRYILGLSILIITLKAFLISLMGFRISKNISDRFEHMSDLKEELALKNAELEKSNAAKSDFLANMSHEIRTPLNGMLGMAQVMQRFERDPEQRTYLDVMLSSGRALLQILNDILDLSKIESGATEIKSEPFCVVEIVDQVHNTFAAVAAEKDITLDISIARSVPSTLVGDHARIRQILMNLVGNAMKFTEGGRVSVRILQSSHGWTRLMVLDTGVGLEADQMATIFDRFQQADNSSTRAHGGAGLGLSISSAYIKLMGGRFGVKSKAGAGSAFWFALPLAALPATEDALGDDAQEAVRAA